MSAMSAFDLFCMRFALATFACLVAGLGIGAVSTLCRRTLPALALQRSVWLLGQLAIAATFMLMLLPQTETLRVVPAIEVSELASPVQARAADATLAPAGALAIPAQADTNWLLLGAQAWLAVYALGLLVAITRLLRSQHAVDRLAASGAALASLDGHAGCAGTSTPPVIEVDAPISPMLCGLWQPRLLLPRHLRSFDAIQQRLIISHELTHWRRRDLQWMGAAVALQTLFWFHPVMRLLRANLSWAQELACDRDVLAGRPQAERKAYASALLAQLKTQQRPSATVLAFGGASMHTLASRIGLIRAPVAGARATTARWVALAALLAVFAANLALQPALAWRGAVDTAAPDVAAAAVTDGPLDCTLLVDAASGRRLQQSGDCATRITPASTFNIAVSLMGFDSGILRDAHTPRLPYRANAGYADWNSSWRRDTDPTSWIKNSNVWYAQHVTAQLGEARLADYLARFNYGNRDVSGDPGKHNGLTMSWISSSMQISPVEQVAFLRSVVKRELPLSAHAYELTAQLLALPAGGGWRAYGKTGTASPLLPDGTPDTARQYGWFVGWATKGARTVVFARLALEPTSGDSGAGPRLRREFLQQLPARFDTL